MVSLLTFSLRRIKLTRYTTTFHRSRFTIKLEYNIDSIPLEFASNIKYLSVIFSSNLLFNTHLDYIRG